MGAWVPSKVLALWATEAPQWIDCRTLDRSKRKSLVRWVCAERVTDNALDAVAQVALQNDLSQGSRPVTQ
jgi:hypothetical protein